MYGLYRDEADALHDELGYLDYIYQCKGCLTCIQNCTKNILTRVENPEYKKLGDAYFTPDIVSTTWYQAETGAVPVSGCGYGGPFSGEGFDSMWTDMSEIVRPTRDGIHGREYINTGVDIGRKQGRLVFDNMEMRTPVLPRLVSPLPIMFDDLPETMAPQPRGVGDGEGRREPRPVFHGVRRPGRGAEKGAPQSCGASCQSRRHVCRGEHCRCPHGDGSRL